jgi:hypothetical protein
MYNEALCRYRWSRKCPGYCGKLYVVTRAQTLDLPSSRPMAVAREIQDLPQLLVTCAGKIRGHSDLQIKAEQNRDAARVNGLNLPWYCWQYLTLDEFSVVRCYIFTMRSFTQWFISQLASSSPPFFSRLIIRHCNILYYDLLFSIIPSLLSFSFHVFLFTINLVFSSSSSSSSCSNPHILLLVRFRILQRMCMGSNSHFGRSKCGHCYNYFTPATKPEVIINYSCLLENRLDAHNSCITMAGDFNTHGFDWKRGLSLPNRHFALNIKEVQSTWLLNLRQCVDVAAIFLTLFFIILLTSALLFRLWNYKAWYLSLSFWLSTCSCPLPTELKITSNPSVNLHWSTISYYMTFSRPLNLEIAQSSEIY